MRLDQTGASRRLDEEDPDAGYEGVTPFDAKFPEGYFLGWTPGQVRPLYGEGMAWPLHPNSDMLLELHLLPSSQPEAVQCRIGLFFSDVPPTKVPFTVTLGRQDLDIPPNVTSYVSRDSYVLPVGVDVYGVQPHAHYLGKEVKAFATLPDGTTKGLIYIREWDFDWQDSYQFTEPFFLPKGTLLGMEFTFDNSDENPRNPHSPPRRVTWGQKSSNEMGDVAIQVVPRSRVDLTVLNNDRALHENLAEIVGIEKILEIEPDQPILHDDVAMLHLQFGGVDGAIAHFRESARLKPNSAAAHNNLGIALFRKGNIDEAIVHMNRALTLDSAYANAHDSLGVALRAKGRLTDATRHLRQSLRIREDAEALYYLAGTLALQEEIGEAIRHYRRAIELDADFWEPFAELSWILAVYPDPELRDVGDAIRLATHAADLTGRNNMAVLDTLAVAYAAAGRFEEAVAAARSALAVASTLQDQNELASAIRQRLALFLQRRPFVAQ